MFYIFFKFYIRHFSKLECGQGIDRSRVKEDEGGNIGKIKSKDTRKDFKRMGVYSFSFKLQIKNV